jgi:hypothetical protein
MRSTARPLEHPASGPVSQVIAVLAGIGLGTLMVAAFIHWVLL